jgi:hypothetical protein
MRRVRAQCAERMLHHCVKSYRVNLGDLSNSSRSGAVASFVVHVMDSSRGK